MRLIRVLTVDHQTLVWQGIRSMLRSVGDVQIVGEAASSEDAVRLVTELKPDVVVVDQDTLGRDDSDGIRLFKQTLPDIEVIVMTDRLNDRQALQAIEAGATGYILKDIPAVNLVSALRSVCNGRAFVHPEVARKLGDRFSQLRRLRMESGWLTPRELDVLIALANGDGDRQIAAKFAVAEGTIKTHIRHILRKLECRNRTQAVANVLREGLIK